MSSLLPIRRLFGPSIALAALISALHFAAPNHAQGAPIGMAAHLTAFQSGPAPQGFHGICSRYRWACKNGGAANAHPDSLQLAAQVNARVNREIRAATDAINYGVSERWTLPYNGRGDCEDIALLKMKRLIEAGVPSSSLLLAVDPLYGIGPNPQARSNAIRQAHNGISSQACRAGRLACRLRPSGRLECFRGQWCPVLPN